MSDNNTTSYFDLHLTGLGYLNRVREVKVPRGKPFLAASIAALHGASDSVEKTWFDVRVSGQEAQKVMRDLLPETEAGKSVLIGFKLGDLTSETFVYEKGPKAGQTGVSLRARLLRIAWAKVDGKTVYTAPKDGLAFLYPSRYSLPMKPVRFLGDSLKMLARLSRRCPS